MTQHLPRRFAVTLALATLALALTASRDAAAQTAPASQSGRIALVRADSLAAAFGLTLPTNAISTVGLGDCVTGTLDDPARLERYGLTGMHAGARVTVMRSAPDKLQVEADELEPATKRVSAVVRLDGDGNPLPKKG